jgi:hypothetical protein
MDPYLEHPGLWPGFHNWLIAGLGEDLSPRLRPRYYVALEERVYVGEPPQFAGVPDADVVPAGAAGPAAPAERAGPAAAGNGVGVQLLLAALPVPHRARETYLEVREALTGDVVTLIEALSPSNKRAGAGRREYEAKRLQTLGTMTHLVEFGLLRAGEPPLRIPDRPPGAPPPGDYRIVVARGGRRPWADVYAFFRGQQLGSLAEGFTNGSPPEVKTAVHGLGRVGAALVQKLTGIKVEPEAVEKAIQDSVATGGPDGAASGPRQAVRSKDEES